MKVCLIVEGAYPYVTGGVFSWMQELIKSMPDVEFVVQVVAASPNKNSEFQYKIPANVSEIQEVCLLEDDYSGNQVQKSIALNDEEYEAFKNLLFEESSNWELIIKFFVEKKVSLNALLTGRDFYNMSLDYYNSNFRRVIFSDFLSTMRSIYLPLFTIMKAKTEQADIYHAVTGGYAGIWASMQRILTGKPFLLTEPSVYTKEREEEIIKADWISTIYKDLWINQFRKVGECNYSYANKVVSLFEQARKFQISSGCDANKAIIIPNCVNVNEYESLPQKEISDRFINIGASLRVGPDKDIKTLISAFAIAKKQNPRLKLWIMGNTEENKEYADECKAIVKDLEIADVEFTGTVDVKKHLGKMDFMVFTGVSGGQPLSILEGLGAGKPCIATNVGNCRALIKGVDDTYGDAGYIVPVMDSEELARAMLKLAQDDDARKTMGNNGHKRVAEKYNGKNVFSMYKTLYSELTGNAQNRRV
ncbi:MAG: GT4 family glycosyltransferase PelF [Clostridia bacterium]|nr:GT4 family glycosyltransferase PelF [Clostridia bacterium]